MMRFLVVGCGGSGGATLAYMMDQLRSELAAYGIDRIPRGWQFVNIDVPTAPEPGPEGLHNVGEQGGRYIGCAPNGGNYGVLDAAVSHQLANLDGIATWAPRDPRLVTQPISAGAGQYRALGRMIALSRAERVRQELTAAWLELGHQETKSELVRIADRVPGVGTFDDKAPPVILVVSSMAGGAGASMALDVCRILTLLPDAAPGLTGVFMVSADIFDSLPVDYRIGVRANSLAMVGEIVASQSGAARAHDTATLAALGINVGQGVEVPFGRVFPVGRFMGMDHAMFGNGSTTAIYRGLGRGLAALMRSGRASTDFVSYDLTNTLGLQAQKSSLGWGVSGWDRITWGAFGYSSLSLGRERYREYSAQRLARGAVDRLLDGHLQSGSATSPDEQVKALVANLWPSTCQRLLLPVTKEENPVDWLRRVAFPADQVDRTVREVTDRIITPAVVLSSGEAASVWLNLVRNRLAPTRGAVVDVTNRAAYAWAYNWHQAFARRTYTMVEDAVARLGLVYAGALIDHLAVHLRDVVVPAAERIAGFGPADVVAIPKGAETRVAAIRGAIGHAQQVATDLVNDLRRPIHDQVLASGARYLHAGLIAFIGEVLTPLREAVSEGRLLLDQARDPRATGADDVGLAQLATNNYLAWPSDDDVVVSARFDHATNDVLLTSAADFHEQFRVDLVGATETAVTEMGDYASAPQLHGADAAFSRARSVVAGQVISGVWPTEDRSRLPRGLLELKESWRSKAFVVIPDTGETEVAQPARFDLHIRPHELLIRARTFVQRPDESFDRFCSVSLRSYVRGEWATESELQSRQKNVADAFTRALDLARPLASVDANVVMNVHGERVQYRYKFSDVPFESLPLADQLRAGIAGDRDIDQASLENLVAAMHNADADVTRIDIFGSYANYTPLAFDMVLGPAAEQWTSTPAAGREEFWRWRRARPLAAALPMGVDERRAMVAGWFLGQLVGSVRIPDAPYAEPVSVWDNQERTWVAFPNPLLTSPGQFIAPYDWLPAVMESLLLAIAKAPQAPVFASLRAHHLLRGLYDDNVDGPAGGILERSSKRLVAEWLRSGNTPSGLPSRASGVGPTESLDDRAAAATEWLARIHDLSQEFVPAATAATGTAGRFATITRRSQAAQTPIFRDLAPDVVWATEQLASMIATAKRDIESGIDTRRPPDDATAEDDEPPGGWTF